MSKLDQDQKNLINLYARSKKDDDGWANVSNQLWPWISTKAEPVFFEIQAQKIRLTEAGKVLLKYACN